VRRSPARLVPVALLTLTAACSSTAGQAGPAATAAGTPGPTSPVVVEPAAPLACTATQGLALPEGWASEVPLPAGFVVTRTERRTEDRLIAYARVPGDFHEVVRFFDRELPLAGLTMRNAEVDPFDAEADFVGSTVQGRWSTGLATDCDGQASLTVLVLPATAPAPVASALPTATP